MELSRLADRDKSPEHRYLPDALEVVKDFPLRETYWLEMLHDVVREEIIFVCGDYHVDTFGARLESNGIKTVVTERQIGMPTSLIEHNQNVREYVGRHKPYVEEVYRRLSEINSGKIRSPFCRDNQD
jgi:hypothetical protein